MEMFTSKFAFSRFFLGQSCQSGRRKPALSAKLPSGSRTGSCQLYADSNIWLNTMSVYLFIQLTTPVLELVLIDGSDCYSVWFCYMAIDALTAIQCQKDLVLSCTWRLLIGSPTQPNQFVNLTASLALWFPHSHLPNTVKILNAHGT